MREFRRYPIKKMQINPNIFRGYDIRGISGKDLNPELMRLAGRAHATYLNSLGISKVVVGSDNRLSSEEYRQAVIEGLVSSGAEVIDLGLTVTPICYWAQYYFKARGCVMVTASHNPAQYNGLKLGRDYSDTGTPIAEIKRIILEKDFAKGSGKITRAPADHVEAYYADVLKRFGKLKKFKVVIDCLNGAGGRFIPEIFRRAGMEVIEQKCELDGNFPGGTPDPTETYIAERLSERVKKEKADVGFSFDADGDRIGIVDDKGTIFWNDVLLAVLADASLKQHPGAKIVYNAYCSKLVDDIVKKAGGKPIMWLTGDCFIKEKAQKEKAPFAGEFSGHFFFLDNFYSHEDAAFCGLKVLEYLTIQGKKLSEIIASYPKYISSPEIKIGCSDDVKTETIRKMVTQMKADFPEAETNEADGIRLTFPDGMMMIRMSQNGPYLTPRFEAKDQKTYQKRRDYMRKLLKSFPEVDFSEGGNLESLNS